MFGGTDGVEVGREEILVGGTDHNPGIVKGVGEYGHNNVTGIQK